jgi:uncharacterized protein YcaQ
MASGGGTDSLSLAQARRITLAAQGFTDPRPTGAVTARHLRRVIGRIGVIQIDSVNVLQRAHYLPLFSRLGAYPTGLLDRAYSTRPRILYEYWAHQASLTEVELEPYLRWRAARARTEAWAGVRQVLHDRPELIDWVLAEVREKGPVSSADIETDVPKRDQWGWNWSDTKRALAWLFHSGQITAAGRTSSFARLYDVPERVLPAAVLATPTPSDDDAVRHLVRIAATALGVAAEVELRDYFRLPANITKRALQELADAGEVRPVSVRGWRAPAYLHRDAKLPRRIQAATVLSPFDPLVWERQRSERLFGFHYRISIYTPADQREHGYYVMPFLLGDEIVARIDLKADRKAGVLRVPAAWLERGHTRDEVAGPLARALRELAGWLELDEIEAAGRGDLTAALAEAVRSGVTV